MLRVAFPVYDPRWVGGLNYIRNLLFAISRLDDRQIEPYVIAGSRADRALLAMYEPLAGIITSSIFDEKTVPWLGHVLQGRLLGSDSQLDRLLGKHGIEVFSHYLVGVKRSAGYRTIGWIPDFQHLHLPGMFSAVELARRNLSYTNLATRADLVVLSSQDACNDFCRFAPAYAHKARVLHFVAQPAMPAADEVNREMLEAKYGFCGRYFFLPNQLWKHKNHLVVFEAVRILKERGCPVTVLCSGHMNDLRNRDHIGGLLEFVRQHHLEEQLRFLGMIDFSHLTWLMRNCLMVINPSLFEGWSTTVEEAKSIGKGMLLSDLPVHREQNPPDSCYFDPHDAEALALLLRDAWQHGADAGGEEREARAAAALAGRTLAFARAYQQLVLEVAGRGER